MPWEGGCLLWELLCLSSCRHEVVLTISCFWETVWQEKGGSKYLSCMPDVEHGGGIQAASCAPRRTKVFTERKLVRDA